ncbi:MAG: glycosyltransferase [Candidatus Saccharimonadales bacterium]
MHGSGGLRACRSTRKAPHGFIPSFNEGNRLPRTLTALRSWLEVSGLVYRVLVVDDGSSDGTASVSDEFGPKFSTLRLPAQRGKGAAVRAGMRAATGRVVAFTDADLPYELAALRIGYEWIESGDCEVVFGARDIAGAETHVPRRPARALASLLFRRVTKRLISRDVTDTQCGLKIFSGRAAMAIFERTIVDGFAFDTEVVWLCRRLGLDWRRVPVTLVNEYSSTLSISRHAWRMLWDVPRLLIAHRTLARIIHKPTLTRSASFDVARSTPSSLSRW